MLGQRGAAELRLKEYANVQYRKRNMKRRRKKQGTPVIKR